MEAGSETRPPAEADRSQEAAADAFYALVDSLEDPTRQTVGFKKIFAEAEDSEDFVTGLKQLKFFLAKRNLAMERADVRMAEAGREIRAEDAEKMIDEIRFAMSSPERFLGNGSTAEVFTLRRSSKERDLMVCVKVITNYARYAENFPIAKEMGVLDSLRHLSVEGVRAPAPLFSFSSMRLDGFAMEHLNAVNFRRVLEGKRTEGTDDELPPGFDVDDYFRRLRAYVAKMHEMGIVHNDLHLRNLMVDRVTGRPYVIDFGKAKVASDLDPSKTSMDEEAQKDLESLRIAKAEVLEWLDARRNRT